MKPNQHRDQAEGQREVSSPVSYPKRNKLAAILGCPLESEEELKKAICHAYGISVEMYDEYVADVNKDLDTGMRSKLINYYSGPDIISDLFYGSPSDSNLIGILPKD